MAVLYSSVGHGGASGYLAVMALFGMTPASMKPTALVLNIVVAGLGSTRFIWRDCFNFRAFWPFSAGALPFAVLGGAAQTGDHLYKKVLGVALVLASAALLLPRRNPDETKLVPIPLGIALGSAIGFLSGLIGIGGGIFLSPILILSRWATVKQTLGISALFIVVNSIAGLLGHLSSLGELPANIGWLALSVGAGAMLGSELGSRWFAPSWVRVLLTAVLLIAAVKLLAL